MQDLRATKSDGPVYAFPIECHKKYSVLNELLVDPKPEAEKEKHCGKYPISSGGQKRNK